MLGIGTNYFLTAGEIFSIRIYGIESNDWFGITNFPHLYPYGSSLWGASGQVNSYADLLLKVHMNITILPIKFSKTLELQ